MAEYGQWNRKGATLSDVTAKKEYGLDIEFIIKSIRAGKLEYREVVTFGNPYIRILRSQLEQYIAEKCGKEQLANKKNRTELCRINKEIAALEKQLNELKSRKAVIEGSMQSNCDPKRSDNRK